MTEQQQPYTSQTLMGTTPEPAAEPVGAVPVAAEQPKRTGRVRRFLAGAMLVTVGVVAGAGTTYAITAADAPATQQGQLAGGGQGGPGTPPDGMGQGGGGPQGQQGPPQGGSDGGSGTTDNGTGTTDNGTGGTDESNGTGTADQGTGTTSADGESI